MKNKKVVLITVVLSLIVIIIGFIMFLPLFEFRENNRLIVFRFKDDYTGFEENMCYDESYSYDIERDISIYNWDSKKVLFFYMITLEFKEGNVCDTEFLLEESYIEDFINNATIKYNHDNIDIEELIRGRKAIVGNTRYLGNDYSLNIGYILNGKHEDLYVFYVGDLLVIQVGLSDEGPKFIAYEKIDNVILDSEYESE